MSPHWRRHGEAYRAGIGMGIVAGAAIVDAIASPQYRLCVLRSPAGDMP